MWNQPTSHTCFWTGLILPPEEEEVANLHAHFDILILCAGIVAEDLLRSDE